MRSSTGRLLIKGAIAYALLIFLGWAGGHRWFLRKWLTAALLAGLIIGSLMIGEAAVGGIGIYLFSAGVLWLVADFFRLPGLVVASGPNLLGGKALPYLAGDEALPPPAAEPRARALADAPPPHEKFAKASRLAGREGASALKRYAALRHRISGQAFDADFAAEVEIIERRHIATVVSEYLQSRPYCTGPAAAFADRTLIDAVDRLTSRLQELSEMQAARDLGELETMEHYLRERHPIARDDVIGNSTPER